MTPVNKTDNSRKSPTGLQWSEKFPHPKTIYRICYNTSNTTDATCDECSAYPFGAP